MSVTEGHNLAMANRVTLALTTEINALVEDAHARGEKLVTTNLILGLCLTMKAVLITARKRIADPLPMPLEVLSQAVEIVLAGAGENMVQMVPAPQKAPGEVQ